MTDAADALDIIFDGIFALSFVAWGVTGWLLVARLKKLEAAVETLKDKLTP